MPDLDYTPATRKNDFVLLLLGIISFVAFYFYFSAGEALAYSVTVGVFLSIIQTKPRKLRNRKFWTILAILAVGHIVVLSLIRIPEPRFGLMSLPFALADGFAIWWLINWIERRFPILTDSDAGKQ